ncbi:hypothetical protein Bca101_094800 [Brassica carinata]
MLVKKKRWRHGYGGKHNVYDGHASGNGRGRVLCGGEGGRTGRSGVEVVVEELMAEEEELMASVELADVDIKVVVAKEVLKEEEPEAEKDQQLYPLVVVEEVVVEKLMAEVEFIAE